MLAFSEILKSQMSKKKKKHKSLWSQFLDKLTDIILIIISVYIALLVESWAEKKHEHQRLTQYYQGFISEAKVDTTELKVVIKDAALHIKHSKQILKNEQLKNPQIDSIKIYYGKLFNSLIFSNSSMVSYKSMLASGDMRLIEDLDMRRTLVKVDESYSAIKIQEDLYLRFLTEDLSHYINTNFDLAQSKEINPDYFTSITFKNLIVSFMGLNYARLQKYQESYKLCTEAIKALEKQTTR
jgi:hypothetical protein